MKHWLLVVVCLTGAQWCWADALVPAIAVTATEATEAVMPAIEHDGQSFVLANSRVTAHVATDEYLLAGEKIGNWTQLLTVQRLMAPAERGSDEFVAYFQKRLEAEEGATLQILKQSHAASVFAVRFPPSDKNDEQVMICLAFIEPQTPTRLDVVQFALKPSRVSVDLAEMRIRSWRDRFLQQAAVLTKG